MSNTKHTPGPWKVDGITGLLVAVVQGQAEILASHGDPLLYGTCDADARLIAAAPDLLAACQEIIDGMVDGKNSTNKNVTMYAIQMVKSAIAKATGTNA
jgi:hypothetical protein